MNGLLHVNFGVACGGAEKPVEPKLFIIPWTKHHINEPPLVLQQRFAGDHIGG
jgi:hypothetical protein